MNWLARTSWCSADPLCVESGPNGVDGLNLAACHSCLLLPEVSCEEMNHAAGPGAAGRPAFGPRCRVPAAATPRKLRYPMARDAARHCPRGHEQPC